MIWKALSRLLPVDMREWVAGDLHEEYLVMGRRRGRFAADVWMAWNIVRLAVRFRLERAANGRPLPPIRDEIRRRISMWDSLGQDVAFGIRMLRRQPGFTAIAIFALALGTGANAAIFSIVDSVLWRPLPYPEAERVMSVAEQRPREGRPFGPVSPADYFDWRRDSRSFSAMAAWMSMSANMTGEGEPERLRALSVSPGFLSVLGIAPSYGRDFTAAEEMPGQHRVLLLTDGMWKRRFGGDPAVVGRTLLLDDNSYEIAGILPAAFWWRTPIDVIVPLALSDNDRALRAAHFLEVIARLQPGVSMAQAGEELNSIGAGLTLAHPAENTGHGPNIRSLHEALVGEVEGALLMLLFAVGFVLLIACANVATLLLARASARQKELSVRRAVGASQGRLAQQLMTESLVVSLIGGAAGLFMASISLSSFRAVLPLQFSSLPGVDSIGIDFRVLLAALVTSTVTGVVFGIVPAFAVSNQRGGIGLNEEARGSSGSARMQSMRSMLVVGELALSVILLAGASLLIISFNNLMNTSPGFRSERLIAAQITLPSSRYRDAERASAFYQSLFERLRPVSGVEGVAAASALPFSGTDARLNLQFENRTIEAQGPVRAHPRLVSSEYLSTMGIPLKRGRHFTDRDNAMTPSVVIINEAAVRRYWPGEDPIGQRISMGSPVQWMEIVGIAGDIRHQALETEPEPEAYIPQLQSFKALGAGLDRSLSVVIRTTADGGAVASILRSAVSQIDPQQSLGLIRPVDAMIDQSVAPRRLNLILVSAFAILAMSLTAAGIYGVMSYVVAQRTREIGVRMALGATRRQVLGLVFRQAGTITAIGVAAGVCGALALTRLMNAMLFGISASDPVVYVGVSLLVTAVALLAVAAPSSRATRVDPLKALRDS